MKDKIDPKILIIVGLIAALLYCGFRSLSSMAAASSRMTLLTTDQNPGTLERLLRDLERTMMVEIDTTLACSDARDPFRVVKEKKSAKPVAPIQTPVSGQKSRETRMRLAGLILDRNPAAIVEVGDKSLEVKVGSLLEGHKVIAIDERGVHILKNGNIVIID